MRAQSTPGRQRKSIQQVHTAGIRGKRNESKFGVVKRRDGILKSEYIRATQGSNFFETSEDESGKVSSFLPMNTFILFLPEPESFEENGDVQRI